MAYSLDKAIEAELRSLPGNNVSILTYCCAVTRDFLHNETAKQSVLDQYIDFTAVTVLKSEQHRFHCMIHIEDLIENICEKIMMI